jgi:hypothetical protein
MQGKQPFDAIDVTHSFFRQSREFAVWPPGVLLFNIRHTHKRTCLPITTQPRLKCSQKALRVHPIRLYATCPTIHFQTRRIHYSACDFGLSETAL